ncbi:MAG: DUF3667 domain-containing protein [Bacteroidetes bacterium]|nr:DUF3667 domain-containing protein [Bacteroidota bacterium]
MNCKNCGELVKGKYCNNCGQNSSVGKITYSNFLQELSMSIFQVDRGFFYTVKALFKKPGRSMHEYLAGRRKQYFKPVAYVLTLSTVYFLVSQLAGQNTWIDDLVSGFSEGVYENEGETDIPAALIWFSNNYAYSTLLLLPVFSLASWISFNRFGKNYLEHLVINSFITGQQAIIYALFALLKLLSGSEALEMFPFLIAFSYTLWVFWQFFNEGSRIVNILRSILTYMLYLLMGFCCLILVMGISKVVQ